MGTAPPVVGLLGLGNMGGAVAGRLAGLGPVVAHDPDAARAQAATEAADVRAVATPEEVVADVVVLSLPTPAVSRRAVEVLAATLAPGSLIVETSTVNPGDAVAAGAVAADAGLRFVDAAILSGVDQMREGTSTLLVGGADADVERAAPVLDVLGASRRHLGPVGAGMAAKVINNAVAHAVMVLLAEAGALAAANGVRGEDLADLLRAPDAGLVRPLTHRYAERVLRGEYEGGMPTEAARKDSTLVLELARTSGVPLFAIQAAHTVYELGLAAGLGRLDYAAIATLWEGWTGRPMGDGPPRPGTGAAGRAGGADPHDDHDEGAG